VIEKAPENHDYLSETHSRIESAFRSLNNEIDLYIIDSRSHEPHGKDAIWEVSLSEWNLKDNTQLALRSVLSSIKSFLQHQVQKSKSQDGVTSLKPFCIVVLGYRESFGASLDEVILKLQRDISWIHINASVGFLDVKQQPAGEAYGQAILAAVSILASTKRSSGVMSLDSILASDKYRAGSDYGSYSGADQNTQNSILPSLSAKKPKVKIALSFDFDALSAFLGTGDHPDNNMSDYSTGIFAGRIGGRRLLRMLKKHQVADKVTWFIPGHTMETFESTVKEIVESGAEIGLHGYAHEGAYQMTLEQERDVLKKCMEVSQRLTGKKVRGYRAPMYQLRETTVALLKENGFFYDSSLNHHDSQPYFTPNDPPVQRIDFGKPASSWMRPTPLAPMNTPSGPPLVEIPTGWNNEDMMALQYFPHLHNSHGHVDVRVVEQRWKDIFLWLWENAEAESPDGSFIFPLLMHPDTSGMAHVAAMVDRFVGWLRSWGDSVEFHTCSSIAQDWLDKEKVQIH
jgi:peptidoglycan/xylan/chitin deacetylase (PgdA/CDA1 family)